MVERSDEAIEVVGATLRNYVEIEGCERGSLDNCRDASDEDETDSVAP